MLAKSILWNQNPVDLYSDQAGIFSIQNYFFFTFGLSGYSHVRRTSTTNLTKIGENKRYKGEWLGILN